MHAEQTRRTSLLAAAALLALAACWGSTFFLIKDLLVRVPTLDFLALRFAIASLALLVVAPKALSRLSPVVRRHAMVLGLLYGVAQILQTAGLEHTAATVSGFITGLYVVCTPLLAAPLLRQRIGEGRIGIAAFAELLAHPATAGVPLVLETPGSRDPDDPQLALLKTLRDAAGGACR